MKGEQLENKFHLPLVQKNWNIYQELLFLKGLTIVGSENWEQMKLIFPKKSSKELKDHYERCFLKYEESTENYLPQLLISDNNFDAYNVGILKDRKNKTEENQKIWRRANRNSLTQSQHQEKLKKGEVIPDAFGYNPSTGIFEQSAFEEIQIILASVQIACDDPPEARERRKHLYTYYNEMRKKRKQIEKRVVNENLFQVTQKMPNHVEDMELGLKRAYSKVKYYDKDGELNEKMEKFIDLLNQLKELKKESEMKEDGHDSQENNKDSEDYSEDDSEDDD